MPNDERPARPRTAQKRTAPAKPTPPAMDIDYAQPVWQALLESAPDAMVVVDAEGRIVIANTQTVKLFGYELDELLGQPIETLVPEALRRVHRRHRAEYTEHPHVRPMGIGLDLVARRKDGSTFPIEVSLSPLRTEQGLLITSVIRDITERKMLADLLEQQVQERTLHLQVLLEFSQELLSVRRLDQVLQQALQHAVVLVPAVQRGAIYLYDSTSDHLVLQAMSGFPAHASLSTPAHEGWLGHIFSQRKTYIANSVAELSILVARLDAGAQQHAMEVLDLDALPTGLIAMPLVAHGQAVGVMVLLRIVGSGPFVDQASATLEGLANLTAAAVFGAQSVHATETLTSQLARLETQQQMLNEQMNVAEAAMLQTARLAAIGQLAAAVAHEINNPLYAVRNCLYLHEQDLSPNLRDSQFLRLARDELGRIANITTRMRDFYRPDQGTFSACDLNRLLEETLALANVNVRHRPINLIFVPAPDLAPVLGNADQIRQVFLNLILNAIDAMPQGGTLTVRTIRGAAVAVVEMQDTGIGIPEDVRGRLFEPFFTTKPTGTGLGLSISAHIVTQHGGQIEVDSEEGEGTTFRVVLPAMTMPE